MRHCVTGHVVPIVSKDHGAFILMVHLDLRDTGTTVIQNIMNCAQLYIPEELCTQQQSLTSQKN